MRARHRHLKPSSMGATIAFDSRYINESDNTQIQTWSDRSGNARDLSQSTQANRPTFRTAVQGGAGVMRFDGSNDNMSTPSYAVGSTTSGLLVYQSSTSGRMILERSDNFNNNSWTYVVFVESSTQLQWSLRIPINGYAAANFTTRSTNFNITQFNYGGSSESFTLFQNGSQLTRTLLFGLTNGSGTSASLATFVGSRNGSSFYYNGDIGMLYTINEDIGDPMRKRMNHHAAYSFKIACS